MTKRSRDRYICDDYKDGKEINEIARGYGISDRRVAQILRAAGEDLRPRASKEKKPISMQHSRLGLHLYTYRFDRGLELDEAANDLGWNTIKLRKIEMGTTSVELLDLLDIAAYTGIEFSKLLEKANG